MDDKTEELLLLAQDRLKQYPADAEALGFYCEALIRMRRIGDLRTVLDQVTGFISSLNLVYERAGDACREKGFHQEAAACYERFLALRPDPEKAAEIIGKMAFLEQQDVMSEIENNHFTPQEDFFTLTMAQLYIDQGHLQDAEVILEEILVREPHNEQASNLLRRLKSSSSDQKENVSKVDHLIQTLSSWLENIERLKINAAGK